MSHEQSTPALIRFTRRLGADEAGEPTATLTLAYQQRVHSRLRVQLDDGREAGLLLPRGETLRDGDRLAGSDGTLVRVVAASEPLTEVSACDPLTLARLCYHLGNRHATLAILAAAVRYPCDPVLDRLVEGLGLSCQPIEAPFEPEPGAYGGSAAQGRSAHPHHHHGADDE
jgi:urease accessory protein